MTHRRDHDSGRNTALASRARVVNGGDFNSRESAVKNCGLVDDAVEVNMIIVVTTDAQAAGSWVNDFWSDDVGDDGCAVPIELHRGLIICPGRMLPATV